MAGLTLAQVVTNIPLSILLASKYGAVGPVVASGIVIAVALFIGLVYAIQQISARRLTSF
jgi:O-antigen/teichoic acid export membrane protein